MQKVVKEEMPDLAKQTLLAQALVINPEEQPLLQPNQARPRCHPGRGRAKNAYGEMKAKRPIWLTPTAWRLLEERCAAYRSRLRDYLCPLKLADKCSTSDCLSPCSAQQQAQAVTLSEFIERLIRHYMAQPATEFSDAIGADQQVYPRKNR
jgi:hypothetical protein